MTVSPSATSWPSNAIAAVETLLANCAMFRTLMGATDVTAAKAKCHWQDTSGTITAPHCVIMLGTCSEDESSALNVAEHVDEVLVRMVWESQEAEGDTGKDMATRELNSMGDLMAQIRALVGTSTYLARAKRTYEVPERTSDSGPYPDCWDATITFSWEM